MKEDISNAINAGKIVTISKTNISFNGWNGCGYIVIDPDTGAGAYKITGGANGAFLYLLWASCFLLAAVGGIPGLFAATFFGVYGTIKIKEAFGIDASVNMPTTIVNLIAQTIVAAGIISLGAAGLPVLVFTIAAIILYATAAMLDFLIFMYTRNTQNNVGRC